MIKWILILVMAVVAYGQPPAGLSIGWNDNTNTHLQTVCPASTGSGNVNYNDYDFNPKCHNVLDAWGGCAADTTRNHLICTGGGHSDYYGNEVYIADFSTNPATIARANAPANWGTWTNCLDSGGVAECNNDLTPVARHTYAGMVYLPHTDKMLMFGSVRAPGSTVSRALWLLDMTMCTSSGCPAGAWSLAASNIVNAGQFPSDGMRCIYDPLRSSATVDYALCEIGDNKTLWYVQLTTGGVLTYGTLKSFGNFPVKFGTVGALDTDHNIMVYMGNGCGASNPCVDTALYVFHVDTSLGTSWNLIDVTSLTSGCSAMASTYPGLTYDSVSKKFIGWPANNGNNYIIYDATTKICTTGSTGTGPSNDTFYNVNTGNGGIFNKIAYFPLTKTAGIINTADGNMKTLAPDGVVNSITTTSPLPAGTHGTAYSTALLASGGIPSTCVWTISAGVLPDGLVMSSAGVISGTPISAGTTSFTVTCANGTTPNPTKQFQLTINPLCTITSVPFPGGVINVPYTQQVTTSECASPTFAKTAGSLPTGLSPINSGTGVISGTPTVAGLFSFTIGVSDTNCPVNQSGTCSQAFTALISSGPGVFNVPLCSGCIFRLRE